MYVTYLFILHTHTLFLLHLHQSFICSSICIDKVLQLLHALCRKLVLSYAFNLLRKKKSSGGGGPKLNDIIHGYKFVSSNILSFINENKLK